MGSSSTNQGFLVVADITGYTAYLNHSELEHAQDVLKALLDLMIDHTKAPLVLSGLEGDAVLSYTIDSDRFEGQAFVEMIEQTYVSFKRAIDLMVMNTSCECNACANINALDLKFFIHHGEFVLSDLGGRQELVGADVNLVHKIMKNEIPKQTGFRAYAFYTDAATHHLGLEGMTEDLTEYSQGFDDIGIVSGWVEDMMPIWEARKNQSELGIDVEQVFSLVEEYPLPPELLWGYLTNPEYRAIFSNVKRQVTHERRNGRVGAGTVYECFHLDNTVSTNTVLEWQPFSRIVTDNTATSRSNLLVVFELEPISTGTRLTMLTLPLRGPWIERLVGGWVLKFKVKKVAFEGMLRLKDLIEEDIASGRVSVPEAVTPSESDVASAAMQAMPTP
jgi:uncharacterized protein YndB with AHSA1/START domain